MEFEWDEAKRLSNFEKHGIDFAEVQAIFDDRPKVTNDSPRFGEERFATTAIVDGRYVTVIWTKRLKLRLISARRARDEEKRAYRELHGG